MRIARAALVLLLAAFPAAAQERVVSVDSIGFTVIDLDRSVQFFTEVLAFRAGEIREAAGEAEERARGVFGVRVRTARVQLGDEAVELTEYLAPRGRVYPADSTSNDLWFQHVAIIVSDMDAAYQRLRAHRVRHLSAGPQTLPLTNPAAGGIRAFYFADPDGHPLEILQFPKDKGDPKWQRTDALFLGIDHTAIVVADTERSLVFYRDRLGLRVAGHSENFGPEQERLNSVFGARLRITTLRASRGPGIELLEYLAPRGGRPAPPDGRANDLWYVETAVTVAEDAPRAAEVARDPDGHALRLHAAPEK